MQRITFRCSRTTTFLARKKCAHLRTWKANFVAAFLVRDVLERAAKSTRVSAGRTRNSGVNQREEHAIGDPSTRCARVAIEHAIERRTCT